MRAQPAERGCQVARVEDLQRDHSPEIRDDGQEHQCNIRRQPIGGKMLPGAGGAVKMDDVDRGSEAPVETIERLAVEDQMADIQCKP